MEASYTGAEKRQFVFKWGSRLNAARMSAKHIRTHPQFTSMENGWFSECSSRLTSTSSNSFTDGGRLLFKKRFPVETDANGVHKA
eukprot:3854261-Pyramimonas_sp.AAC.1